MGSLLSTNHWRSRWFKQRVTTKQLRQILLEEGNWFFRFGQKCTLKSRNLGNGVHEIWLEVEE